MRVIELSLGLRLGRGGNDRGCWAAAWRRREAEKKAVARALDRVLLYRQDLRDALPVCVTLTRVSPSAKGLDAHDNLPASCKYVADAIADWLEVDDAGPVYWSFRQEQGPWELKIRIEASRELRTAVIRRG